MDLVRGRRGDPFPRSDQVAGDDLGALGGEPLRLGRALAAGGPADDDDLAGDAPAYSVTSPPSTRSACPVTAASSSETR